jgi:AcrR family transcriptional regulator
MGAIATSSGVTKALLYQYFDSKEGLYTACVERARARMFERLQLVAERAGPDRMLAAVVEEYFDQLEAERGSWYVLYGDAPQPAVNAMRDRNAAVIAQLLEAGSSLSRTEREVVAQLIVGAGEQVGRWWLERREVPPREVKRSFTVAVAGAIGALEQRA